MPFSVVFLNHRNYPAWGLEIIQDAIAGAGGTFKDLTPVFAADQRQAYEQCRPADIILVRGEKISNEIFREYFGKCRLLLRVGIGCDNLLGALDAANKAGCIIAGVPNYCSAAVAAHTLAIWLYLARQLGTSAERMKSASGDYWFANGIPNEDLPALEKLTFGILGYGSIGSRVAKLAAALGCSVIVSDPYAKDNALGDGLDVVSFNELLRSSDVVSLHAPALEETVGMINRDTLALAKRGITLLNTARGSLVRTADLVDALHDGKVHAAGLDVHEEEPLPAAHPLREFPPGRVCLTEHMASQSAQSRVELFRAIADSVVRVGTGRPPRSVFNVNVIPPAQRPALVEEGGWTMQWIMRRARERGLL